MRFRQKFPLLAASILLIGTLSAADKIYLGKSLGPTGEITKVDETTIYIKLDATATTAVSRSEVTRVEISKPEAFWNGITAVDDGKFSEGVALLEPFYVKYQGLPDSEIEQATLYLGKSYLEVKEWSKAKDLFTYFKKAYPKSLLIDSSVSGHARALLELDQADKAANLLEKLVEERAKESSVTDEQSRALGNAFVTLGLCYLKTEKNERALEAFLKTTTLYFQDKNAVAHALFESASLFEKMNNRERAMGQLEELIAEFSTSDLSAAAKKKLQQLKAVK
jgi:TolA-binding protein